MAPAPQVLLDHADARIVRLANLFAVEWRGTVRAEDVRLLGQVVRGVRSELPGGVGVVMLIRESSPVPTAPVRDLIKTTVGSISEQLLGNATIIEGKGIAASTVRTAINAMRVVIRQRHPERAFSEAREALDWLQNAMRQDPATTWTLEQALQLLGPATR